MNCTSVHAESTFRKSCNTFTTLRNLTAKYAIAPLTYVLVWVLFDVLSLTYSLAKKYTALRINNGREIGLDRN